jgi:membrane protein
VKQPKFRWVSVGAAVAILAWILASVLFGFYVGNFGSYNKTYGALAGLVVFLLWLWITNLLCSSVPNWTLSSSVDANCRRASRPKAFCNCPAATAGPSTRTRPNKNRTSNARTLRQSRGRDS